MIYFKVENDLAQKRFNPEPKNLKNHHKTPLILFLGKKFVLQCIYSSFRLFDLKKSQFLVQLSVKSFSGYSVN